MDEQIKTATNYLSLKSILLILVALSISFSLFAGKINLPSIIIFLLLLAGAILQYFLTVSGLLKSQAAKRLSLVSIGADLLLILLFLYYRGLTGTAWLFAPVILIFFSAYQFNALTGLVYALASFLGIALILSLADTNLIPQFSLAAAPAIIIRSLGSSRDSLLGTLLIYFSAALAGSYLNRQMGRTYSQFESCLTDSEASRKEVERSRIAILNVMDDLEKERATLDTRVKQRTTELEEAKSNLETKVAERTSDLEASRKAIVHMMKDLKEDMEKLKIVDRMKTEFLSMISHELRTPLTPIKGFLYLILDGKLGPVSTEQKRALEIIARQSDHLHLMIDNILDISRFELGKPFPIKPEKTSLKQIIEETAEAAAIQAKVYGHRLKVEVSPDLPLILADGLKIRRVLTNLLGNAIKFTPENGKIRLQACKEGDNIRVEIADNGIGIEKENLEKIFDKFFQADSSATRSTSGIGMGLTICKEFINLHGGRIWGESEGIGKGSKFVFLLPIKKEAE
jgi:signal transduction histidine kinase